MSTLTPVKLPVDVLYCVVVLVVDKASVDSLCPRRHPRGPDAGEATKERSVPFETVKLLL